MGQTASVPAGGNIGFSLLAAAIYAGDWPTGQGGRCLLATRRARSLVPSPQRYMPGRRNRLYRFFATTCKLTTRNNVR